MHHLVIHSANNFDFSFELALEKKTPVLTTAALRVNLH